MNKYLKLCAVFSLLLLVVSRAAAGDEDLDSLVNWLPGSYSSLVQHEMDSSFAHVVMKIVPVPSLASNTKVNWYYMVQAMAHDSTNPYIQRVYSVRRVEEGMIEFKAFEFTSKEKKYEVAANIEALENLSMRQLRQKIGCEMYFQMSDDGFIGGTHGTACRNENGVWVKSELTIRKDGMRIWNRGYDSTNELVWGDESKGYILIKNR
ncbi:MAG: hypothetical protein HQ472_08625 [Ignavibacteria bacterium]|nr:hypothetical protein [Ignavibacteria bacterium]